MSILLPPRLALSSTVTGVRVVASLVICAYNEERNIGRLLRRLSEDSTGLDLEIIVVSCSTDGTDAIVTACSLVDERIRLLREANRFGKAKALSHAMAYAKGVALLFIDADTLPLHGSVFAILEPFWVDKCVGVTTGSVEAANTDRSLISRSSRLIRDTHDELCLYLARLGKAPKVNGTFFAVRRGIAESIPIDTVSDDEYFSHRAQAKGYRVVYVPRAIVRVVDPFLVCDYIRKRVRIIAGHFWLRKRFGHETPTTSIVLGFRSAIRAVLKDRSNLVVLPFAFVLELLCRILVIAKVSWGHVPFIYRLDNTKALSPFQFGST